MLMKLIVTDISYEFMDRFLKNFLTFFNRGDAQ
ncbi:hypothetical protein SAMN05444673_0101 [Bacillus sp. OV166]|nr:hypothetical protein SAMN05444673_0101 [Bacillus sp. OV166]